MNHHGDRFNEQTTALSLTLERVGRGKSEGFARIWTIIKMCPNRK